MDQNDLNETLKRYLDLGLAFTQMSRNRAEELVRDLARRGMIPGEQNQYWVDAIVERSHQASEALISTVRREVSNQVANMSLATKEELANLASRVSDMIFERTGRSARTEGGAEGAPRARRSGARKAASKKSKKPAARRTTVKKSPPRRAAASKAPSRRTAKKATAKKATAKRSATKKAASKAAPKRSGAKRTSRSTKATKSARSASRSRGSRSPRKAG